MTAWHSVAAFLGPALAAIVFLVVRGRLRERRIGTQLDRLAASGRAALTFRVRGDAPYPSRWTTAQLAIEPDGAVLRPREAHLPEVRLPGGRLEVLHVRAAGRSDGVRGQQDDLALVTTADGSGAALLLLVPDETVGGVLDVLDAAGYLAGPAHAAARQVGRRWRRFVPTWSLVAAVAGLLVAATVGALWLASVPVQVQVTGAADEYDYCPVAWADPWDGRPQDAQISCGEEQPGDLLPGLALPLPFRGEVFDTESFPVLMLLGPLSLLLPAAAGVGRRAWQLRGAGWSAVRAETLTDARASATSRVVPPLPPVSVDLLDADTAGQVAAARSVRERWAPGRSRPITAEEAEASRWWALPPLRRVVGQEAMRSLGAAFFLLVALLGGWTAWGGWSGTDGDVRLARAAPGETMETVPFFPDDVEVTFAGPAGEERAVVAVLGDVPKTPVTIMYSADDPQRARLVGQGDGTGRGMLLSAMAGAGGLAWVLWCLRGAAIARREVLEALRDNRRVLLDYVLTADPEGEPVLLLWAPRATAPAWFLPLADPVLGAVPLRGTVEVRGAPADGATVVPVLPDRVLWPASRAAELDRELAALLICGALPADSVPPNQGLGNEWPGNEWPGDERPGDGDDLSRA